MLMQHKWLNKHCHRRVIYHLKKSTIKLETEVFVLPLTTKCRESLLDRTKWSRFTHCVCLPVRCPLWPGSLRCRRSPPAGRESSRPSPLSALVWPCSPPSRLWTWRGSTGSRQPEPPCEQRSPHPLPRWSHHTASSDCGHQRGTRGYNNETDVVAAEPVGREETMSCITCAARSWLWKPSSCAEGWEWRALASPLHLLCPAHVDKAWYTWERQRTEDKLEDSLQAKSEPEHFVTVS